MGGMILWQGRAVAFRAGESVASALLRSGVRALGQGPRGAPRGMLCGIGQCQGCVVQVAGRPVEACLTPCAEGLVVEPGSDGGGHD